MRWLVATFCLFSTATSADRLTICSPPLNEHYTAHSTITGCSKMLKGVYRTSLFGQMSARSNRAMGYEALGDTDRELADLNFIIDHAEALQNRERIAAYDVERAALTRRAEIYEARGMMAEAKASQDMIVQLHRLLLTQQP